MWRRLTLILTLGIVALILAYHYGPAARQRRGMQAARDFRQRIEPAVRADPRFAAVEMTVMTHPSVRVHGEVPDPQALRDLEALCRAPADVPFIVFFHVKPNSDPATQPAFPTPHPSRNRRITPATAPSPAANSR